MSILTERQIYDIALAPLELAGLGRLRRHLLADARGAVLEIGAGTGVNLAHYGDGVRVFALDENREMLSPRLDGGPVEFATMSQADAQSLPFTSAHVSTVVWGHSSLLHPRSGRAFRSPARTAARRDAATARTSRAASIPWPPR